MATFDKLMKILNNYESLLKKRDLINSKLSDEIVRILTSFGGGVSLPLKKDFETIEKQLEYCVLSNIPLITFFDSEIGYCSGYVLKILPTDDALSARITIMESETGREVTENIANVEDVQPLALFLMRYSSN